MHMFHIMRPSVDHRPDFFVPGRALHYNTIVDTASMMARQNQAEGRQVVGAQGVRDVII